MYDKAELERILQEARKSSEADARWKQWLEQLVDEVRRLQAELDYLTRAEGVSPQALSDTSLF